IDDKWGYINKSGLFVSERIFDEVPRRLDKELNKVKIGKKWGYIDKAGKLKIQPKFQQARHFSEGLAAIMFDDQWGYINIEGQFYIFGFDKPKFPPGTGLEYYKFDVRDLGQFSEGWASFYALVRVHKDKKHLYTTQLTGYIDKRGDYIVPPIFKECKPVYNDLAIVLTAREDQVERYGIINRKAPIPKDSDQQLFFIPPVFAKLHQFISGYLKVAIPKRELYIDFTTKENVRVKYEKNSFSQDISSQDIFKAIHQFSLECYFNPMKYERFTRDDKLLYNFIDRFGNLLLPTWYEDLVDFTDGLAQVKIDGKYGFFNYQGEIAIKPQFDYVMNFSENLAAFRGERMWGYIDRTGSVVIEPQFLKAGIFHNGIASVALGNGVFGYIDKTGKFIFPPSTKYGMFNFNDGLAKFARVFKK
ncbi:MAG: WG repeat-containing protein, partial [Asgard group archaeon]|nr:WG repeat-containing protein [Asgard group archaeon]